MEGSVEMGAQCLVDIYGSENGEHFKVSYKTSDLTLMLIRCS